MAFALEASCLGKSYGSGTRVVHALQALDLSIPRGGVCAILGPTGAGIEAAAFPNLAANALHQASKDMPGDPDAYAVQLAVPGAIALALWCVAFSAAAMLLFRRQDLSKE